MYGKVIELIRREKVRKFLRDQLALHSVFELMKLILVFG